MLALVDGLFLALYACWALLLESLCWLFGVDRRGKRRPRRRGTAPPGDE